MSFDLKLSVIDRGKADKEVLTFSRKCISVG